MNGATPQLHEEALHAAADAVLAAFRDALDHGALNRHQHSALRLLEAARDLTGPVIPLPAPPLADRRKEREGSPTPPLSSANPSRFIGIDQEAAR